jgi:hypothetical protein
MINSDYKPDYSFVVRQDRWTCNLCLAEMITACDYKKLKQQGTEFSSSAFALMLSGK